MVEEKVLIGDMGESTTRSFWKNSEQGEKVVN